MACSFSGPWIGFLSIFGAICVRLYGADGNGHVCRADSCHQDNSPTTSSLILKGTGGRCWSCEKGGRELGEKLELQRAGGGGEMGESLGFQRAEGGRVWAGQPRRTRY
eukprot:758241-Hanusia_phi.AAC.5